MNEEQPMARTSVTLENQYGTYSISVKKKDMTLSDTMDYLIKPALIASGFSESTIDNYWDGGEKQ